jgi:hypothetical protein
MVLTGHVFRQVGWGPLLAGSLVGIGLTGVLRALAGPAESPPDLVVGLRCSFVPVLAGLAFLLHEPHRQLTGALPVRVRRIALLRVMLVLPVVCAGGTVQLLLAARALRIDLGAAGQSLQPLTWPALATEFAAWCLLTLAFSAGLDRTRWHDLTGVAAAFVTMVVIGLSALLPWHLLPAAITAMSAGQRREWMGAWLVWGGAGVVAAASAAWAAGDPWRRLGLTLPG